LSATKTSARAAVRPLSDFPELGAAWEKLNGLRYRQAELEKELARAKKESKRPLTEAEKLAQARAYLDGGGPAIADPRKYNRAQIRLMRDELAVLADAVALQAAEYEAAKGEVNRQRLLDAGPEYQAIVKDLSAALNAGHVAQERLLAHFAHLTEAGVKTLAPSWIDARFKQLDGYVHEVKRELPADK
jgi:hypothetical protein